MAARKSLTTPDSNSMVLKAAVEPEMKKVSNPSITPVAEIPAITASVRSRMSVPAVVLYFKGEGVIANIARINISKF